jgi:MYXO-CTERM domain-containing protein
MQRALASACLVLALASPTLAYADAIGGCPQGQMWQGNPTPPGAMHHGGGTCVPDPSASHGCAVSPARSAAPLALAMLAGLAIAMRRRDKVRAR